MSFGHSSNCVEDGTHLGARRLEALRGIHDKIGAPPLFRIGHLLCQDRFELLRGHPGALEHTRALDLHRRRHNHDGVDALVGAGLEQERNIEHHDLVAARLGFGEKPAFGFVHEGVNDGFEPFERGVIAENAGGQPGAIDLAGRGGAGKGGLDRRHRVAFVKPMHDRVGIVHRHAFLGEEARRNRFPHTDRAGETENEHAGWITPRARSREVAGTCSAIHAARQPSCRRNRSSANNGSPRITK